MPKKGIYIRKKRGGGSESVTLGDIVFSLCGQGEKLT